MNHKNISENKCPKCGSENIIPIVYRDFWCSLLMNSVEKGECKLGAGSSGDGKNNRHCKMCEHQWIHIIEEEEEKQIDLAPTYLEARIKAVYHTGLLHEKNEEEYLGKEHDQKIVEFMEEVQKKYDVQCEQGFDFPKDKTYGLAFTLKSDPSFWTWTGYASNYQLAWINSNNRNFAVLWLRISRIYPAYEFYYNIRKPRPNTEYLDTEITYEPHSEGWEPLFETGFKLLDKRGITQLPKNILDKTIPNVLEDDWNDIEHSYDDENWDDYEVPPRVVTTVNQCLFQTH
ncbi:MAG: hypothetical protein ISS11_08190 [Candidatus Marinimicrobia bacterium]|nr:hypothetical protein [Candidatus Neomarinimicrobiota bacterium]